MLAQPISVPFRNRNQRALAIGHGGRIGGGADRKLAARDGLAGHQQAREGSPVAMQQRKFAFHQVDGVVEIGELALGGCDPLRKQIDEPPNRAGLRAQFLRNGAAFRPHVGELGFKVGQVSDALFEIGERLRALLQGRLLLLELLVAAKPAERHLRSRACQIIDAIA